VLRSLAPVESSFGRASAFATLDDTMTDGAGVRAVRLGGASAWAIAAHLARRARLVGRPCIVVPGAPQSLWREVAQLGGLVDLPTDVDGAVDALHRALEAVSAVVVGSPATSAWDDAVTHGLATRGAGKSLVLLLGDRCAAGVDEIGPLADSLDDEAIARWWAAAAVDGRVAAQGASLARLEGWWRASTRGLSAFEASAPAVDPADRVLWRRLSLAGRAWPTGRLGALGALGSRARLEQAGVLATHEGSVVLATTDDTGADAADRNAVAGALSTVFPADPWAHARSAELLATDDVAAAEAAHARAITLAIDAVARIDLWSRWGRAVDAMSPADRLECASRAVELALERGDVDAASSWAERLLAESPTGLASLLALGRACRARGDVVAAGAALDRALGAAVSPAERADVLASIAEVRYAQGSLADAERAATEAEASAGSPRVRLSARNTLGKLMLARGDFRAAESHFAADAQDATARGEASASLRAQLNRAIAVLSDGRLGEAKPMLEHVLATGEASGDARAVAFALANLAVLAINRHDYAEALARNEQAIAVRRRLGERLDLARTITNLAQLRLRLGLTDEAEQALRFGRAALARGSTIPRAAHFALVAAQVFLSRGDTVPARREIQTALAGAPTSSDAEMLSEAHRVSARIALEDGDLERAERDVELAEHHSSEPRAVAELALLRAMLARGLGHPATVLAATAVRAARDASDEGVLLEAHVLAAEVADADGDAATRARHLRHACALRDDVAESLPEGLRARYLSRRELGRLSALSRASNDDGPPPPPTPRASGPVAVTPRQMVGDDPAVRSLLDGIRKVARTDATVLVYGESGTGKELVAEALHAESPRRDAPLVKVNCAALVESLLLSELFGHEKGSFTGASARRRGRFELAEGGTLFLDEIGDISPATQVALLRVLQERTYERVGGTTPLRADVRVVCATNRDLAAMVQGGTFREDLYFRLTGIVLRVPALRDRAGDLPAISRALLARIADERGESPKTLSAESLSLLARHRWPGNIRELENALRAASLFAEDEVIRPSDVLDHVESMRVLRTASVPEARPTQPSVGVEAVPSDPTDLVYAALKAGRFGLFDVKRNLERECISRALAETRGNITRAAALLGMKRPRLSQLVKQYGLAVSSEGSLCPRSPLPSSSSSRSPAVRWRSTAAPARLRPSRRASRRRARPRTKVSRARR
jgi:DNA-binding NtrC family response regulator/tetratricopeptide (TPR) repeat protein